jgi:hypothetical protein
MVINVTNVTGLSNLILIEHLILLCLVVKEAIPIF